MLEANKIDVVIIGAGFAGIGAGIKLKEAGITSFKIFEKDVEIGGTWRDNTYPGCACDIPSFLYSYSFEPNPNWSRAFSPHHEILAYLKHCVNKYGIGSHIQLQTEIKETRFDETSGSWTILDNTGKHYQANVIISAPGPLNRPLFPKIDGIDSFAGESFHSMFWNHDYDFKGKRVAVIGTGASAIQFIPEIAKEVAHLTVFQRSAPWIQAKNDKLIPEESKKTFQRFPWYQKFWRELIYWFLEYRGLAQYADNKVRANRKKRALDHLHNSISDEKLIKQLTPNYEVGCKRVLLSDNYYPSLERENVALVTDATKEIRPNGIVDETGKLHEVDAIIYGTGFYTTTFQHLYKVIGLDNRSLFDEWDEQGGEAYYGITSNGFPNLLHMVGPNTGLGHNSIIHMMESQLSYILDYLKKLQNNPGKYFDIKSEVQEAFNKKIHQELAGMIWSSGGCNSYYLRNHNGKNTSIWPGSTMSYRKQTRKVNLKDYRVLESKNPKTETRKTPSASPVMTRSNKHTMELFDFAFYEWEKSSPHQALLRQPFGDKWEEYSWAQVGVMARKMANGLRSLNMPAKAHVGIYSKNCREWVIADIAILMAGYVSVPFFATLSGEQLQEVLELGDVKALFVGKVEDWDNKKEKVSSTIPKIAFPHYKDHSLVEDAHQWEDIMAKFEPIEGVHTPMMDDVWTIIFTSGTTGTPKGVVLTYRALEETKWSVEELNPVQVSFEGDNRFFSYLPLNHIAERVVVEYTAFKYGGTISFTESLATFSDNLIATKPTIFFAVPRILSKFQSAIRAKLPQEQLDAMLANPEQATTLKKQLQVSLGLDEARAIISGAAPLSEALKDWCASIGLPITNGYGMTENCAIATILLPNEKKPGSVGRPQPRVEIRIDEQSSEILMKGPFLMSGYYKSPEKTKETLVDGWLRTGDMGYLDDDGFLYITGRVKDTFKSSKGEFIVPAHLEKGFSGHQDIEQVCILGLGCPQPVALLVLSEMGRAKKTKAEIEETLRHLLDDINQDLPSYQKISTIVINQESWTVENHLLTPTLKVKRNMLHQRYANDLMLWHERPEQIIWEQEVH